MLECTALLWINCETSTLYTVVFFTETDAYYVETCIYYRLTFLIRLFIDYKRRLVNKHLSLNYGSLVLVLCSPGCYDNAAINNENIDWCQVES